MLAETRSARLGRIAREAGAPVLKQAWNELRGELRTIFEITDAHHSPTNVTLCLAHAGYCRCWYALSPSANKRAGRVSDVASDDARCAVAQSGRTAARPLGSHFPVARSLRAGSGPTAQPSRHEVGPCSIGRPSLIVLPRLRRFCPPVLSQSKVTHPPSP